jgi:hypothetical protein
MDEKLKEAIENFLEFTKVARDMRYAERILYEMDLSDDAFDESVYQIKLFYGDQTGEYLQ